jgi:hypothetical protein
VGTLPTPAERAGDFSQSATRVPILIYDNQSGLPFPGNRVPAPAINRASRGLLDFIPLPNQPGRIQNYQFLTPFQQNTDNLSVRFNQPLSKRNRLSASAGWQARANRQMYLYGWRAATDGGGLQSDVGLDLQPQEGRH